MPKEIKKNEKNPLVVEAQMSDVLLKPLITESSTNLVQLNKYVFLVSRNSNKQKIARAVEGLYKVTVEAVNIINIPKKKRVYGKTSAINPLLFGYIDNIDRFHRHFIQAFHGSRDFLLVGIPADQKNIFV